MSFQLRSYLYLDEEAIDDFLAQIEGSPTVGPYSEKEVTLAEPASMDSTPPALEVNRTRYDTLLVRVSHLLDLMDQGHHIQSLDVPDPGLYETLRVRNIVEISGTARLPKWEDLKRDVASASSWVRLLEAAGLNPLEDDTARLAMDAFTTLSSMGDTQESIIILAPSGGQKFQVTARLKAKYLRRARQEFVTELTILGKIQKKLVTGQEIDVVGVWPKLASLQAQNRQQRRQAAKKTSHTKQADNPIEEAIREVVKYPAIEILPVAIYQ